MEETKTPELVGLLLDAIINEPYFDRKNLEPKLTMIIKTFRLRVAANNYNAIPTKTKTAKYIRSIELKNHECDFWKTKLQGIIGKENMRKHYDELGKKRLEWGGEIEY